MLAAVRAGAAAVARRARSVVIDDARLEELADRLVADLDESDDDPIHLRLASDEETLAFVVTLDAVNFGSGWFPALRKPDGRSGYFTIASALRRHFEHRGALSASELEAITPAACAELFGQDPADRQVGELMALFARSLRDLGGLLRERCDGSFVRLVELGSGSAACLVEALTEMPLYRDVSRYDDFDVPFYKRAQITATDLANAFGGEGWGAFRDLDRLTLFADNLVPHVLRLEGVLRYAPELARRIDTGELIASGSSEEVEIRATALHAVERCVAAIAARGGETEARRLDAMLWRRGQCPEVKSHPRHRTRTTYY